MNRRNLFKFLGALPLLAITPKKEWGPLNPDFISTDMNKAELWYAGPNKIGGYRWVARIEEMEAWIEKHPKYRYLIKREKTITDSWREMLDENVFTNFPGEPKL